MSRLAKAVHRGADGSVHYLASSRDGSELIITDPVVGLSRVHFDGPCRSCLVARVCLRRMTRWSMSRSLFRGPRV